MKNLKVVAKTGVGIDSEQMKEDVLDSIESELTESIFDWDLDWHIEKQKQKLDKEV